MRNRVVVASMVWRARRQAVRLTAGRGDKPISAYEDPAGCERVVRPGADLAFEGETDGSDDG